VAGIAALAIYSSVAVGGARGDLIHGNEMAIAQYNSTADIWVTAGQTFNTEAFNAQQAMGAISRSPGIASVGVYQGALLDWGDRRLWVRARPPSDDTMIESSQIISGNIEHTNQLLRKGGWAAISDELAVERRLTIGDRFALPTPSGSAYFKVASITTNSGWPPGTITIDAPDFHRYWQTGSATALEVHLKTGVSLAAGLRTVHDALGGTSGLRVQTYGQRAKEADNEIRQGLNTLGEIANFLLISSVLAVVAALSTAIYQRRTRLASLKAHGFDRLQLWRSLLAESAIVLAVGCLSGAVVGVYGHALADRYLRLSSGFPAPFNAQESDIILMLLFIVGLSVVVLAIPGYSAAGVPIRTSFEE
jgi:putative ABC transport system permease protein